MMRGLVSAAAVAALAASASAEPLLSFGPDIPLFVTASASVRRDNNINLTATDRQSDTIFVLAPGLEFHHESRTVATGVSFSEQFVRYASAGHRELDSHLANAAGNFAYTGSQGSVSAAASYVQQDQSTLTISNINQAIRQSVGDASLSLNYGVTAKTKVGLGAGFDRTSYPDTGYNDSSVWSFPADLYYAITPKVDLSAGYRYSRTELAGAAPGSHDDFFNLGARGDFTPKLSGQVRAGVTRRHEEGGGTDSDLGLGASFVYLIAPKTTINLSGDSGFTTSPLGTTEKTLTIAANAVFTPVQQWTFNLGGSYNHTVFLTTVPRHDQFWVGDAGLTFIWTPEINFSLQEILRHNHSDLMVQKVSVATFTDNVVTFTAASRF